MDIDHVRPRIELQAPHLFEELGASHHLLGMEQEMLEQLEFARREIERIPAAGGRVVDPIELYVGVGESVKPP
jgi:hypothetical protein